MKKLVIGVTLVIGIPFAPAAIASDHAPWAPAVNAESIPGTSADLNTVYLEGCPGQSPDALTLYVVSGRPGGEGGLDIWVARRSSTSEGWGAPVNLGQPINSAFDDLCPTPVRGKGLYFVSARSGGCGASDIYFARRNPAREWVVEHLDCVLDGGPNTTAGEASPSYVEAGGDARLFFSSGPDIYQSERRPDGSFGPGSPVVELNSASADLRPNVRKDGLEIVFDSDRPGGLGGADIYVATRASVGDAWSDPVNLGGNVNSAYADVRAFLSWDGRTMYLGSTRPRAGGTTDMDIYVTTRTRCPTFMAGASYVSAVWGTSATWW
jgi:hypothetical protein